MSGKRQKTQYSLALEPQGRGETPVSGHPRAEPFVAKPAPESPAVTEQLMEEVCDGENLQSAWKRVRRNQGSPGVDGMTIDDAKIYLREHWPSIRSQLLNGTYQPQPVKRDYARIFGGSGATDTTASKSRNTQAGRRGQKTRRALRRRQTDPASPAADSPEAVGPNVFQAQLRLPTGTLRPSGGSPSATIHCRGLQRRS